MTIGCRDLVCMLPLQQSTISNKTRQRSNCICAATKPKEKQLVAIIIVVNDEAVAIHNVLINSRTRDAAGDFLPVCTHTPVIKRDLFNAIDLRLNRSGHCLPRTPVARNDMESEIVLGGGPTCGDDTACWIGINNIRFWTKADTAIFTFFQLN
jgi:hypothetical protein